METKFDLKSIRKEKGMKQEELANAVGISPQAVSKWEQGGMPDAALLPSIADALGVSIDALFGRKQEETSFYDLFLKHMLEIPSHEKIREFQLLGKLCAAATCNVDKYYAPNYENISDSQYTEATWEEGFFQGRLGDRQPYFLLIPEPKEGYEKEVPYNEDFVRLYETLASPHALRAMYFIENNGAAYFDTEALAAVLSISAEEAARTIERLADVNLIAQSNFSSGTKSKKIYRGKAEIEFIAFLYFSQVLMKRPSNFTWQTSRRDKAWFNGRSYAAGRGQDA